ncbi:OmpH family outer membrane protein [Candidatus Pelagibacter bacterium]|jgi:outer membrane protein|nr:OmpH family outer membrane protein [Candidatus Pelagibacter bacterium]
MKIYSFFIFFFIIINLSNSHAEIYYIDVDKIINQTKVGKHINIEFENLTKKINTKNLETKSEFKKREENLIAQKNIIDENEFNKKLNIFRKDVNDFNQLNQKTNQDLKKKLLENKTNFLKLIEPILLDYVKDNNITYLLQKKYIIVGHNDMNKTSDIIELVDNKINISKFNDSISK